MRKPLRVHRVLVYARVARGLLETSRFILYAVKFCGILVFAFLWVRVAPPMRLISGGLLMGLAQPSGVVDWSNGRSELFCAVTRRCSWKRYTPPPVIDVLFRRQEIQSWIRVALRVGQQVSYARTSPGSLSSSSVVVFSPT